jgi:hypothetical protein
MQENLRNCLAGKEEKEFEAPYFLDREQRAYTRLMAGIGRAGVAGESSSRTLEEALGRLREEVREKSRSLQDTRDGFSGLLEVSLAAGYSLPFVKAWGSSNLEELKDWYQGAAGKTCLFLCFLLTVFTFFLLAILRFESMLQAGGFPGIGAFKSFGGKRYFAGEQTARAELLRFYDWILLKRENPSGNLEDILEGFLPLAGESRKKVERLFYDFMQYGMETLETARDWETSAAFSRLLEGLLGCDQVALPSAFEGFEGERAFYLEQRKEAQKKQMGTKTALGKVLAFFPMYGVMLLLLAFPFTAQGLAMLESYSRMLGG